MTSPTPLLYNAYYHIFNRGINRENIFVEERNYEFFMKLYDRHIEPVAETLAYCLLKNHFHLLVRIRSEEETLKDLSVHVDQARQANIAISGARRAKNPLGSDNPSRRFSNLFNAYAKSINKAYGRTGSLFQHPFGRVMVTSDRQLWNIIAYIHQNPQKHKFVQDFREWKYSSYSAILSEKPTHLKRDEVLNWFGGVQGYLDSHTRWITEDESKWFAGDDNH
jgi:REP element-mobilizing transposase RayT